MRRGVHFKIHADEPGRTIAPKTDQKGEQYHDPKAGPNH